MIPIGIAAGHVKRPADIDELVKLPSDILSSVTLGSYTLEPRNGNEGTTYVRQASGTSLNALGLPNPGIEEACRFLPSMIRRLHESGKQARVSIAGFSTEDYVQMAKTLLGMGMDELELNLGCPNIRDGGEQKPIFAFEPKLVGDIIGAVYYAFGTRLAVKLSPYSDPRLVGIIAEELDVQARNAKVTIVTSNTFPNATAYDGSGKPLISANNGYAGAAGTALHEIAVGQVKQFREALDNSWNIIGVGGIDSGQAARNFELAGATSCQIGTAYFDSSDPRTVQRIVEEYVNLRE